MSTTSAQNVMASGKSRGIAVNLAAAVGAVALSLFLIHALDRASGLRKQWPEEVDTLYLPSSSALKSISLGHRELFADLLAARTNVYFGDQMATRSGQKWLHFYLNTVVDLDPHFQPIYMRGAAMLVYGHGNLNLPSVFLANDFLERGLKTFPDDWELWFQLGFNKAFEMPGLVPKGDNRIAQWKREGTEALRRATLFDGIPAHFPNLVARMLTEQGERELAIQHLERTYAVTSDPLVRQQIRNKIMSLLGEEHAARFEQAARRLARTVGQRYPYAGEAFSLIAGPRRSPATRLHAFGGAEPGNRAGGKEP